MQKFRGIRLFLWLALISGGGLYFSLYPGTLTLDLFHYKIQVPLALALVIIFVLIALFLMVQNVLAWCRSLFFRSKTYLERKRYQKFEDLILDGMSAIAGQDFLDAETIVDVAQKMQPDHPMTWMLMGQTAYLKGDYNKAQSIFLKMTERKALAFLGFRGLALMALEKNDGVKAEELLRKMYGLRPTSPWVLNHLKRHYLMDAKNTPVDKNRIAHLEPLPFYLHMTKEEADLHQGLLLWIRYHNAYHENLYDDEKLVMLKEMHDLVPKNPVIASELAYVQNKCTSQSRAVRVLEKTFKRAPHRLLVDRMIEIVQPETPLDVYKKTERFCASNPLHDESLWVLAKAALKAGLWGQARHHVAPLLKNPTSDVCRLMENLDRIEYPDDPEKAALWKKQSDAAPFMGWQCTICQTDTFHFDALCLSCGAFGTLEWSKIDHHAKSHIHYENKMIETYKASCS